MEYVAPWNTGDDVSWSCGRVSTSLYLVQRTRPLCRAMCPFLSTVTPGVSTLCGSTNSSDRAPFRRQPESLAGICVSWNKGGAASRVHADSGIFVLHAISLIWPGIVGRLPRGRSTRPKQAGWLGRILPLTLVLKNPRFFDSATDHVMTVWRLTIVAGWNISMLFVCL